MNAYQIIVHVELEVKVTMLAENLNVAKAVAEDTLESVYRKAPEYLSGERALKIEPGSATYDVTQWQERKNER